MRANLRAPRLAAFVLAVLLCGALAARAAEDCTAEGNKAPEHLDYQLSYIDSGQAVQLLDVLGYTTVSYGGESAETAKCPATADVAAPAKPCVIRVLDPTLVTLVEENQSKLGGQVLSSTTTGIPEQRLLIEWRNSCELQKLLALLHDQIDRPAKQILIEAIIIELTEDSLRDLGVEFSGNQDGSTTSFGGAGPNNTILPFSYMIARPAARTLLEFTVKLQALVTSGQAEVLSQPSVLVMDGRQARIKVGDKFPFVQTSTTQFGAEFVSSTEYIDVGIVLNLRPRASADNSEVTMQVETQVSSSSDSSGGAIGPQVANREVQTIVRVANDTPFVIAGLISRSASDNRSGIPFLSKIPGLGKLFRRSSRQRTDREVIVVIVPHVIPPEDRSFSYSTARDSKLFDHFDLSLFRNVYRVRSNDVFDLDFIRESSFYQCLEKTARAQAENLAKMLRTSGRTPVAARDTAALSQAMLDWAAESPTSLAKALSEEESAAAAEQAVALTEQFVRLLQGRIPGEDVLVKRMLLEIIERLDYARYITEENIIFFEDKFQGRPPPGSEILDVERLAEKLEPLRRDDCNTLELLFVTRGASTTGEQHLLFDPPSAQITDPYPTLAEDEQFLCSLRSSNCLDPAGARFDRLGVLLNDCFEWRRRTREAPRKTTRDLLRHVLVLKRLLDLNPTLPLTLEGFHVGREIVFPTAEDLRNRKHLVDRDAAQLFFETLDYYYAFEQRIRKGLANVEKLPFDPVPGCAVARDLERVEAVEDSECTCSQPATGSGAGTAVESAASSADVVPAARPAGSRAERVQIVVDYRAPDPAPAPQPPAATDGVLADAVTVPVAAPPRRDPGPR